jgi:secreted trypsin-like serine protease
VVHRRPVLAGVLAPLLALAALLVAALAPPPAGAIVGGTDKVSDSLSAPLAFIQIREPNGLAGCSGTLIAPAVVMTAAHCVYETSKKGNLLGIAPPSAFSLRIGSRDVSNAALGSSAHVVAVLPQPYYRWDGLHHFHDVALLALDRPLAQAPATLAEQRPGAGKPLVIAGYGRSSTSDHSGPSELRIGQIDAADPTTCHLVSEAFNPSWLFCGSAADSNPAVPGGTACFGDSGGPAFASENTAGNVVVEGVISYGTGRDCENSRSYLTLVSSERGFIDRALATDPASWGSLRDDPPTAAVRPVNRRVGHTGFLSVRIDDDRSRHSRVDITIRSGGRQVGQAFRSVPTNRWVKFRLRAQSRKGSSSICVQGTDGTKKESNKACTRDVVR